MRCSIRMLASLRPKANPLFSKPVSDGLKSNPKSTPLKKTPLQPLFGRKASVHPTTPARTRFAPSPTGLLHLGSLRTALYNYLLAKQTNGTFIVRLEDTDQKRLVPGAEQNIYDCLKWAGIEADESPVKAGPHGPYRQSERGSIYQEYVKILLEKNLAYKCYCSKDRLLALRESAQKLKPPTTVTYDRKCLHGKEAEAKRTIEGKEANGKNAINTDTPRNDSAESSEYVVRFRAPDSYEKIEDLRHGTLDLQPQFNLVDRRFDDFVIMKSDGLPTYHFANVVDDHLMGITHVIRGEEWLTSTPKHVALYRAFGWEIPKFVHIPLLTSLEDKKLSKRHGDVSVSSFAAKGFVAEALVNFVALFGWSPPRPEKGKKVSEVMSLAEMKEKFRLDNMTKGNVKVAESKLTFFNKQHLSNILADPARATPLIEQAYEEFQRASNGDCDKSYFSQCVAIAAGHLEKLSDLHTAHPYFFQEVDFSSIEVPKKRDEISHILQVIIDLSEEQSTIVPLEMVEAKVAEQPSLIRQSLRYALTGMVPGVNIADVSGVLGYDVYLRRLKAALAYVASHEA